MLRTCDTLALNDCKMANKVTYCYCDGDLCNSRPASSFRINDQSNYDASESGALDDDQEDEDYGDEFSGMQPTAPFPGGIKSDHFEARGNPHNSRGRGSTPGSSWSTTGRQGMYANSQAPAFHYPATIGPTQDSSSGSCRWCKGPVVQSIAGCLLITLVLYNVSIRLVH